MRVAKFIVLMLACGLLMAACTQVYTRHFMGLETAQPTIVNGWAVHPDIYTSRGSGKAPTVNESYLVRMTLTKSRQQKGKALGPLEDLRVDSIMVVLHPTEERHVMVLRKETWFSKADDKELKKWLMFDAPDGYRWVTIADSITAIDLEFSARPQMGQHSTISKFYQRYDSLAVSTDSVMGGPIPVSMHLAMRDEMQRIPGWRQ